MKYKSKLSYLKKCDSVLLVSVIIPVYNVRPFLIEALDSVINQTYTNLEIIIIDDGSTDGSGEICDRYKRDSRVKVIHQNNKGLSAARNAGLDLMIGEAVVFLDSDDFYDLDYIKLMVANMNRDKTDMVVCKYSTVFSSKLEGKVVASKAKPSISSGIFDRSRAIQALYNGKLNVNVWNKLYRAGLWDSIRFSEGHVFEDNEVAYRILALCNSIGVIDNVLYIHRRRIGSITTTESLKNYKDRLWARSRVEEFIRSNTPILFAEEQAKAAIESTLAEMIRIYTISFSEDSEWQMFREELRTSIIARSTGVELKKARIRVACMMIRFCPWLLKPLYLMYLPLRKKELKISYAVTSPAKNREVKR